MSFTLIHACCDGAGVAGHFADKDEAIAEADRLQVQSDSRGNPYSYHYTVFGYGERIVYQTKSRVRWACDRYIELNGERFCFSDYLLYGADGYAVESFCMVKGRRFPSIGPAIDWANLPPLDKLLRDLDAEENGTDPRPSVISRLNYEIERLQAERLESNPVPA